MTLYFSDGQPSYEPPGNRLTPLALMFALGVVIYRHWRSIGHALLDALVWLLASFELVRRRGVDARTALRRRVRDRLDRT